jgi:hypothetical protein
VKRDTNKYPDAEAHEAAAKIAKAQTLGQKITRDATLAATDQMVKLMAGKFRTKEQKIATLEHHAFHMGIGKEFMGATLELAQSMTKDLVKMHREHGSDFTEEGAQVLTDLWLAKVFMEIEKGIKNHED